MSEFLKFAYELIAQIIYYLVACVVGFFGGLLKLFVTGVPTYVDIFRSYYGELNLIGKVLSILLCLVLVCIPIFLLVLLVRGIVLRIKLRATADDNMTLYKEIGRLNRQVLTLMDEKNRILNLRANVIGAPGAAEYVGATALSGDGTQIASLAGAGAVVPVQGTVNGGAVGAPVGYAASGAVGMPDPLAEGAGGAFVVGGGMGVSVKADGAIGEDAIANAAAAAAAAAAQAKAKAEEHERSIANRFPKLSMVDLKYEQYEPPEFDDSITLRQFAENYRLFACSQLKLYYTPEIVRRFVAGLASSQILILEGISGTGKTSLPYSFSRFLDNPATMVSVQPSFRERTELLGYFNEFSKRFNETEFLRALYEAGYREDLNFIVLDEMNLARIEYYFAEMLSVLEMPSEDERVLDLVPTAWQEDPIKLEGGKIRVPPNVWYVGTANNDDSTFTITDKVYDRAMPIELNEKAGAFECPLQPKCYVSYEHVRRMFEQAKEDHPISEATMAKMIKLDQYLQTRFKLAFGNRIQKQMYDFVPVYVGCGGTEVDGMDYIVARKVLKKFESQNVSFVRDEIKGLITYLDKIFGEAHMQDSRSYLQRIQNLY